MTEEPTDKEIFRLKKYIEILEEDNKWCHSIINKLQQRGTKGSHTHTHRNLMIDLSRLTEEQLNELELQIQKHKKQMIETEKNYKITLTHEQVRQLYVLLQSVEETKHFSSPHGQYNQLPPLYDEIQQLFNK